MTTPPQSPSTQQNQSTRPSEYWDSTKAHSDTFRSWLIAYGIAVPYLAISQKDFLELAKQVGCMKFVIGLFFLGAFSQVIQVAVAKYTMMVLYCGEAIDGYKNRAIHKKTEKFSEKFWPYITTDILTVLSYIIATLLLFSSFHFEKQDGKPTTSQTKMVSPVTQLAPQSFEKAPSTTALAAPASSP